VHGVKKWPDRKMERYLSAPELARLGEVLSEAEREGVNPSATNAIRLLTLTGCRKSEVLSLRWEEVDFQNACLRLGDAKTGQRVVPIGAPAVELLASLRHIGTSQGEYILPGSRGQGPFKGLDPVWRRLRVHAGLPDVRLYDLRHTLASVMAGRGESLLVIGKVLGHKVPSTTACYSHLTSDVVRTATEGVSAEIAAAMSGGGGNGAEVVELDTKRRAGNE
jgi:integrase